MRRAVILALIPLAACDQITNTYDGLTASMVGEGVVLGVEAPESDLIDLSGTAYGEGTGVTMFLGSAEAANNIASAPIEGALVSVSGPSIGEVAATDMSGGVYTVGPDSSLVYQPNATWTLTATVPDSVNGDDVGIAHVVLPAAADVTIPQQHTANTKIDIDLTGQGFTSSVVVVVDTMSGSVTFSNEPMSITDVYDMTRGNADVGVVTVPASAFPGESVYALGIAGLAHTTSADFDNMNTAVSAVAAGKMRMFPVITAPMP